MNKQEIASYINHTELAPQAKINSIILLCQEAIRNKFYSVCVAPCNVPIAVTELNGSDVKICTVIGFPSGCTTAECKIFETTDAIKKGADEIDVVLNIGDIIDGRYSKVCVEIAEVVKAAKDAGTLLGKKVIVKTILETCLLDDEEIENACLCAKKAGADYIKTSTGFANPKGIDGYSLPNGASAYHVKLIKDVVGDSMGIEANGGIRSARSCMSMIEAGATRIGTASGPSIVSNWR